MAHSIISIRFKISLLLILGALLIGLTSCGEGDVIAFGTVTDSMTGEPLDSVRVVQFWVFKDREDILIEVFTDSLGRYSSDEFVGCGIERCRFMLVFEKEGYQPQTQNNLEEIDPLDIRLQPN